MTLTAVAAKNALPREKIYRLADSLGMYLEVHPNGGRYWRLKYRFGGKEKRIALGVFPEVSLKEARLRRDHARQTLSNHVDPSQHRKSLKAANIEDAANSFESVAREWYLKFKSLWTPGHAEHQIRRLELYVFPWIGSLPISKITASELLGVMQRIESRGANETAHRTLNICTRVFTYAITTARCLNNPGSALKGALAPTLERHFPSITEPAALGALLRAIDGYEGTLTTRLALQLAPLVFVRPGELRKARWIEIDWDSKMWKIPAERMKMKRVHLVPLSEQAYHLLRELHPLTGSGVFLFPGARDLRRPMSENTVNAALRRLGYSNTEMTGHGFRSTASTLLNEQGWNRDAIERQLAHGERDSVRAAYNFAEHLPERRRMMQAWADFLQKLRESVQSR